MPKLDGESDRHYQELDVAANMQLVERVQDSDATCLVCGGPMAGVDVFVPNDSARFGNTRGALRVFVYAAGEEHAGSHAIEDVLLCGVALSERIN